MGSAYQSDHGLAYPALPVVLRHRRTGAASEPHLAMLDTGADATLVPRDLLATIGKIEMLRSVKLRSHWGELRHAPLVLVDLEIAGEQLNAVEVVVDEIGKEAVIGRNILNRLIILLDGPGLRTDLLTRRPSRLR